MRLGELADEPSLHPEHTPSTRWAIWIILSGLFAIGAVTGLIFQNGPVACTTDLERACIIERVANTDLLGAPWRPIDEGSKGLAIPILEKAHYVELTKSETHVSVDAWTKDGLHIPVVNIRVGHAINSVDALEALRSGGGLTVNRDVLVNHITRHTVRHTLALLPVSKLIGGSPNRTIQQSLNRPLGDALAQVGVQLRNLTVVGAEIDAAVGSVVERVRASRTRIKRAQEALLSLRKNHRELLTTMETQRIEQINTLRTELAPQLHAAEERLIARTRNANQTFEQRRQFARLKREVEQIRLEALAEAARQSAGALDERVKALAAAGPELLDLEIADRIMGRLGAEKADDSAQTEEKE